MIEYARAVPQSQSTILDGRNRDKLTLVPLHGNQFRDGSLKNANVPAAALASAYGNPSRE